MSLVVVNWDGADLLGSCLDALLSQEPAPDEVIVVDNGSKDGSVALLSEAYPAVKVVELPENRGFAAGANAGIEAASGDLVGLVNNDAQVAPGWLAALTQAFEEPSVGFATPKLLDASGNHIDSAGDYLDRALTPHQRGHGQLDDGRWDESRPILSACAAATLYRRELLAQTGGFASDFFAYFEDADLCLRARALGWTGRYVPTAYARHSVSATSRRIRGFKRYQGTRNAWYLLVRNVPVRLLVRVLPRFLFTQIVWLRGARRDGELGVALRGHRDGLVAIPRLLRARSAVIDAGILWPLLEPVQVLQRRRAPARTLSS